MPGTARPAWRISTVICARWCTSCFTSAFRTCERFHISPPYMGTSSASPASVHWATMASFSLWAVALYCSPSVPSSGTGSTAMPATPGISTSVWMMWRARVPSVRPPGPTGWARLASVRLSKSLRVMPRS